MAGNTPRDARDEAPGYGDHADRAEEIGFLADNLGARQSVTADFEQVGYDYEHVREVDAWSGETVDVYQYDADGETRWVAAWAVRPAIDDPRWHSLVFETEPDADAIEIAAEIVNAHGDTR